MFPPEFYAERCLWDERQTLENWISERVLKLTCTTNDMKPLADEVSFSPPVYKWNPTELDAAFFLLYGIDREYVEYILSTFSGVRKGQENVFDGTSTFDRILMHYDDLREKSR